MKVKIYFDNENQRYKIYNGDTIINATEVTINEIPIDEQLSDTSANAVENRTVKKALDDNKSYSQDIVGSLNKKVDANKSDTDNKVGTLNSRIDEVIGQGMRIIKGTDISWTWTTSIGNSSNFQLPADTVVFIAIPRGCTCDVKLNDVGIYDFGNISATNTQVGIFVTGSEITASDNFSLYVNTNSQDIQELVEADTILLIADSPQELKDIRVDYFGLDHKSAGDSVRSILDTIQSGKISIDKVINWINSSTPQTTNASVSLQSLPLNTDLNIKLPAHTTITFLQYGTPTTLGDLTAEDIQNVVYNTGSQYPKQSIYLNTNSLSLSFDELIASVSISTDFNIFFRKDTEMSDSSENVVQNKVIKEYIDKIIEPFILIDTAKGSEITLNDSVDRPIKAISIMGKSTQEGTPTIDNPIPIVDVTSEEIEVTDGTNTQTAEFNKTLRGIPVASGGNYTDNDGQAWICDTIEKYKDGTGKYIQRVIAYTFNGSENWQIDSRGRVVLNGIHTIIGARVLQTDLTHNGGLFSYLPLGAYASTISVPNVWTVNNQNFNSSPQGITQLSDWTDKLDQNNAKILLPLETVVETPLTAEEIAELELNTYYPTTNINSNTDVVVEYVCTTQGYIDKRLNN